MSPTTELHRSSSGAWAASLLLACFLALAFQGSRGIWEPDEGFYSNVAAGMVHSGDYWLPRLNDEVFLDKPPLLYWGIAAGLQSFGFNEWGARAVHALWFVASALMVGLLASAIWGPARGPGALLLYALMLGPFVAANILTPDSPLTFCVAAAAWTAWRWAQASGRGNRYRWSVLFGLAVGLGVLAKGPAMLVFTFPLALFVVFRKGWRRLVAGDVAVAAGLALAVGGSWYASMIWSVPGAFEYLFDNQVSGRLWSEHYNRNSDAFGALRVYLPVLVIGTLPWCVVWLRRFPGFLATRFPRRHAAGGRWARVVAGAKTWAREGGGRNVFLLLGIVLPVVVLVLARSRLPLYIFPVLPLIAVAGSSRPWSRKAPVPVAVWVVFLIGVKLASAHHGTDTDSRLFASALEDIGASSETAVVSVEKKRNGLAVYGFTDLRWVRIWENQYPYFRPPRMLDQTLGDLTDGAKRTIFIAETHVLPQVESHTRYRIPDCLRRKGPPGYSFLDCRPSSKLVPSEPRGVTGRLSPTRAARVRQQ